MARKTVPQFDAWCAEYPLYADLGLNMAIAYDCPPIDPVSVVKAFNGQQSLFGRIREAFCQMGERLPRSLESLMQVQRQTRASRVAQRALRQKDPMDALNTFFEEHTWHIRPGAMIGVSDICPCYSDYYEPSDYEPSLYVSEQVLAELHSMRATWGEYVRLWVDLDGGNGQAFPLSILRYDIQTDRVWAFAAIRQGTDVLYFAKASLRSIGPLDYLIDGFGGNPTRSLDPQKECGDRGWYFHLDETFECDGSQYCVSPRPTRSPRVSFSYPVDVDEDLLAHRWGRWEWEGDHGRVNGQRSATKTERMPEAYRPLRSRRRPLTQRCEYPRRRW